MHKNGGHTMSDLYNRIYTLCQSKGISVGKMCNELSISRGNLTELKMGRIKTLNTENLTKISGYFGISIDYLLGNDEKKETPAESGERTLTFDDFTYAMHEASKNLSERDKQILLGMAEQLKKAKDKE